MEKQWVHQYGDDNDQWSCDEHYETREEAITAGARQAIDYGAEIFQVGRLVPAYPNPPDAKDMIDNAIDSLYDDIGEAAECWEPTDEQTEDLQRRLDALWSDWAKEHGLTDLCHQIIEVTDHDVR